MEERVNFAREALRSEDNTALIGQAKLGAGSSRKKNAVSSAEKTCGFRLGASAVSEGMLGRVRKKRTLFS